MRFKAKRLLLLLVAIFVFLGVPYTVTFANDSPLAYEVIEETEREIMNGLKHIHAEAYTVNDAGAKVRQNVNVLFKEAQAKNIQVVSWAKFQNGRWTLAPLHEIAEDFEAKNPGWRVIAGVNGDFFTVGGSINLHLTLYGDIYKPKNSLYSVGISEDGTQMGFYKALNYGDYYLTAYDPDTYEILIAKLITGINLDSLPSSSTAVFYDFGEKDIPGTYKYLVESPDLIITHDDQLFLKGKITSYSTAPVYTTNRNFAIVTNDAQLISLLSQRPIVRIQKILHSEFYRYDTAIGSDATILKDGRILTFNEMIAQGRSEGHVKDRHPRTAIGITENGDLLLGIIDGRQKEAPAGVESHGVDFRELAAMFKHYGAVTVYNLDGGGSSQMVIRNEAGEFEYVNSPSEGPHIDGRPYRSDANGLLLVIPDVSVLTDYDHLAYRSLDLSYSLYPDSGVEIVSAQLKVNDTKISLSEQESLMQLTDLNDGLNAFQFIITYIKDGQEYTRSYAHKFIDLSLDSGNREPIKPTFNVTPKFNEKTKQLIITVEVNDPEGVVNDLILKIGEETYEPAEVGKQLRFTITVNTSGTLSYQLIYTDYQGQQQAESFEVVIEIEDEEPEPGDEPEKPQEQPKEKSEPILPIILASIGGLIVILGTVFVIVLMKKRKNE